MALCGGLVLFRVEARQHRTSVLNPSSYKFGLAGMVVYLVMYGVLVLIEEVCFGIGRIPAKAQWERQFYKTIRLHGLSHNSCGASSHGLRHAYAHARYEQIIGFAPRCKFESRESFCGNAQATAGDDWSKADQDARQIIKAELGHGPDRDDVMAQYLGSK